MDKTPSPPSQQENDRPIRTRKPVSRLIPSFEGKSYGTTMAQISARMVGLSATESIKFMESELTRMSTDDNDATAMGIIMAHMSVKQATKKSGVDRTTKSCVSNPQMRTRATQHERRPKLRSLPGLQGYRSIKMTMDNTHTAQLPRNHVASSAS